MTNPLTLPEYEDLIESLANQLGGLSVVHRGLGDAATAMVTANRELAELRNQIQELHAQNLDTYHQIEQLDPASLEQSFTSKFAALDIETRSAFNALNDSNTESDDRAAVRSDLLLLKLSQIDEHLQNQQVKYQQFGKLTSLMATGATPHQTDLMSCVNEIRNGMLELTAALENSSTLVEASLGEINDILMDLRRFHQDMSQTFKDINSTTTNSLDVSQSLAVNTTSKLDSLQRSTATESAKILRLQAILVVVGIAVLISVWLTA